MMKRRITLEVDDYIYTFYQKGAGILQRTAEDLMEQALFMYAGIVARDLIVDDDHFCGSSIS